MLLGRENNRTFNDCPTAWHKMFTPKGEADTSAAAKSFGTNYVISSFSTLDLAQIRWKRSIPHLVSVVYYKDVALVKRYYLIKPTTGLFEELS